VKRGVALSLRATISAMPSTLARDNVAAEFVADLRRPFKVASRCLISARERWSAGAPLPRPRPRTSAHWYRFPATPSISGRRHRRNQRRRWRSLRVVGGVSKPTPSRSGLRPRQCRHQ
jgi:hypothetical protein